MNEHLKAVPSKVPLEQFDLNSLSKDKIRDLFRTGKIPTAEAMVDEVLLRAAKEEATDLHFEPAETELRIRLGHEGVMKILVSLPKEIADNLNNVLKTKASMNAFEKKKPQEGRFSQNFGGQQYDIRVSTVPVMAGERLALRILHKTASVANIEELGFTRKNLEIFRALLRRPNGLLIVSGSSSSGKSTTVYAAVKDIQTPEKNVITVENPIEYKLDFASQVPTSTDKSFTFADALRAILRQNPNIIMLGEIREAETGIVAAEAALTGQLVITTMLCSDAINAIPRLVNLGIPPYLLASTLTGILHQQLVRTICPACTEEYQPTAEESARLHGTITAPTNYFRGKGCEHCQGTGMFGRTAVHEILIVNDQLRDLIYQQASILKLKEAARLNGFEDIVQDAARKVADGRVSIGELMRAFG